MRKLSCVIGVLALLLVAAFFVGGAVLPADYAVTRSVSIGASAEEIYAAVGDLDQWSEWTAWNSESFPELEVSIPGPASGAGAIQVWKVAGRVGQLEITSAEPTRGISYTLSFEGEPPIEGIITFVVVGESTDVVWLVRGTFEGARDRWLGLTLDSQLGGELKEGLERLSARFAPPPTEPSAEKDLRTGAIPPAPGG